MYLPALCSGRRCTSLWSIWKVTQTLRVLINKVSGDLICCLVMQIQIWASALLDNQCPACHWCQCWTTSHLFGGSPRCRRLMLSWQQRLSTTQHRRLPRRFYTSEFSWICAEEAVARACIEWGNNVIGGRELAKRIDIRSTSPTQSFRRAKCALSMSSPRPSWRISWPSMVAKRPGVLFQWYLFHFL